MNNQILNFKEYTQEIAPLPESEKRPLWSVMIPTYNPTHYINQAIESVLSQHPGSENMQIEVVDDCSTKVNVEKIVSEIGDDRVKYFRNPRNMGHSFNYTESIRRAKGRLIHLLHHDDMVKPGFYSAFEKVFERYPGIGAAYCRQAYIDENGETMFYSEPDMEETGILDNALIKLAEKVRLQYCAMVVKRQVYEHLGGFYIKNISGEDWEMWVRIAAHYPIAYEQQALAEYRIHKSSISGKGMRSGQDMRDLQESINLFNRYLPKEKRAEVKLFTRRYYANYSFENAKKLLKEFDDEKGAAGQISETINLDSEIVYNNLDLISDFKNEIEGAGVSVVICSHNDEMLISDTILGLVNQRVPKYIPWEIILVDRDSYDNTIQTAAGAWKKYLGKVPFKIIKSNSTGIFETRSFAIENARYNFILFCNPGESLGINYVRMVSENMMRDMNIGVLGASAKLNTETTLPNWIEDKNNHYFQTGPQADSSGDITLSRGFVFNTGMAIRKEAWTSLVNKNFKSIYAGSESSLQDLGIISELCQAMRLDGWKIWYNPDLSLKRTIPESNLTWRYLRNVSHQSGADAVLLRPLSQKKKPIVDDFKEIPERRIQKDLIKKTYRKLKSFKDWKLISYSQNLESDKDIVKIEYYFGMLRELLKDFSSYNEKVRFLRRTVRKKDFKYLKFVIGKPYFRFPQYKKTNETRGVSVVINYGHTSHYQLLKSLEKVFTQKLPVDFTWGIVLICNFINDDLRKSLYKLKQESNCHAPLKILNKQTFNGHGVQHLSSKDTKYKYLIFLNENNLIYPDYVRIAYKIIHRNNEIGILGGQTELQSEVNPPNWFNKYKEYYEIGEQADRAGELSTSKPYLWSAGMVVRKEVLEEINNNVKRGFQTNGNMEFENFDFCNKVNLNGWKIWYEPRLRLKNYVSVKQFDWGYLRNLSYQKGKLSAKQERFVGTVSDYNSYSNGSTGESSRLLRANKILGEITKHSFKKIFSRKTEFEGDSEVVQIEQLRGKLGEILKSKPAYKYVSHETKKNVNGNTANGLTTHKTFQKGISIIIPCYNNSKALPDTLKSICTQRVPDNIPWEVIIVDNASTDNTYQTAKETWYNHNCLATFKVETESILGQTDPYQKGLDAADYEYIIICKPETRLHKDFVKLAYEIMSNDADTGAVGGQSKAEADSLMPQWLEKVKEDFGMGKPYELRKNLTWTKDYIKEAPIVVRRSALNNSFSNGLNTSNLSIPCKDALKLTCAVCEEICYSLRNSGWKIRYDPRLKSKYYFSGKILLEDWKKSYYERGIASAKLDKHLRRAHKKFGRNEKLRFPGSLRKEIHAALFSLRRIHNQKHVPVSDSEGDGNILAFEFYKGRLEGLLRDRKTYNRGVKQIKKSARRKDFYKLSYFRKFHKKFPEYNTEKNLNGVSIIVCTYNGAERLPETIRHIAKQKVDHRILWEVILVDNASSDNSKKVTKDEWDKYECNARLRIVDQPIPGKQLALEKGYEAANYEYLITCDDDNWLEENFVQFVYEIMSGNENIGALGGPNEAVCEIDPPEWFKYLQKGYAAGEQGDIYTGKVSYGNITWKRGFVWGAGMVVRKSAWEKLMQDGFKTSMSCRKGTELTSGGDSEECYALSLAGWEIWYDSRLKLKHCMPAGRLTWDYLVRLFRGFGVATVGLELYEKAIKLGRIDISEKEINSRDWWYEVKNTYKKIRKYGIRKILSLRFPQDNHTEILMLEFYISKLRELFRVRKEYNKKFEELKNATWKKSYSQLRSNHRRYVEAENNLKYGWPWREEPVKIPVSDSDKKTLPKISILSPSYNSEGTIEKAILSVVKQNYPNFEHIICDAGSGDNTVKVLKKYPHLKWVSEPDKGQSDAMNKAFKMCTGEIIVYLNVDDYFQRGIFYKVAETFQKDPSAQMVVGNLFFEYSDNTFMRKPEIEYKKIMLPFLYMFPINPVSYFYRRKVQEEIGPFPIDNHFTMDYWFLLKAYQDYNAVKLEDFFGTFCMNGFNKTSIADNRKNTHIRVLHHCWNYDRKSLPYYLYNYYKYFYYDKKVHNIKSLSYKTRKNFGRIFSLITLKKNKYYSQKLYELSRIRYYEKKKIRSALILLTSFLINPRAITRKSRWSIFLPILLGRKLNEKAITVYKFFTLPPGMPLSHKLNYYGNEFRKKNKPVKGNLLLLLTYIISPSYLFKSESYTKKDTVVKSKVVKKIPSRDVSRKLYSSSGPIKNFINYFRYKKYKTVSDNYFERASEKLYFHKRLRALVLLSMSTLSYPRSFIRKSRLTLLAYSIFGSRQVENLKLLRNFLLYPPGMRLSHKLNYYGYEFKKSKKSVKGNLLLLSSYVLSPSYILKRQSKASYSEKKIKKLSPIANPKRIVSFFKYRNYKTKSENYYQRARERYYEQRRMRAIAALFTSFLLYPLSIRKKSRLNMVAYLSLSKSRLEGMRSVYNFWAYPKEMSLAHKINYHGRVFKKINKSAKGNALLFIGFWLSPKLYFKNRNVFISGRYRKTQIGINNILQYYSGQLFYKLKLMYHYFRYRKFKAQSKSLYARAQKNYHSNRRFASVMLLIPSFMLYPLSIFNRNKWGLMIHSVFGNFLIAKLKGGSLDKKLN